MDDAEARAIAAAMSKRERERLVRDVRRKWLRQLGWTVRSDSAVYAPGDREEAEMHSLATAARAAGLPSKVEDLLRWKPDRTSVASLSPASERSPIPGRSWKVP